MSRASKRRCRRVNEGSQNGTVEEGDGKKQAPNIKYFAVCTDASQVGMRVQYEGKDVGRFTHRINRTEKSRWVMANFLVELITHYGGRKPTKRKREYQDMNLRSLQEVFQALPKFPETLVGFLNEYTPEDKEDPVPEVYRNFIIQTWKDKKDEVLSLYEERVQPTTSAHVVLGSRTDEMEIGEREAQLHERNKTCTNHDTISKDIEVPWQEHIDKCLSVIPPISREDVNRVLPEVCDVEEENHLAPFRTDEMEIGEREAEFSRQTISQHSEIVVIDNLLQRFNNRFLELEKIIADLQAQDTRFNNRIVELKIVADLQAQDTRLNNRIVELEEIVADLQAQLHERNTASLSVIPPITHEDVYRVLPEVPDGEEGNWLAGVESEEYINQT